MPLRVESKRIGDSEYKVTQLDAIKGRRVLARLTRVAAPVLGKISADKPTNIADILSALGSSLEDDVDFFCDSLAPSTEVSETGSNKSPRLSDVFALHFAGRYSEMLQWLQFAIEVNFADFFRDNR